MLLNILIDILGFVVVISSGMLIAIALQIRESIREVMKKMD